MEKDITFTSTIRPVKKALFDKIRITIPDNKFVDYPWTCKESVRGKSACTTNIRDCTMCGITDGQDVFMMHICPTQDANSNFLKIKDFILKRVNFKKENLSAFVLGAKEFPDDSRSSKLFDKFVNFLKSKGVPVTSIKGDDVDEPVDVLYKSKNDEWLISSYYLDRFIGKEPPEKVLKRIFPHIELAEDDIIID